jgi:Spy/CpxP family protein refolding chaperone
MRGFRFGVVSVLGLALASLLFAQVAGATTTKSPEEMAKEALAKWKTTLKITDEQAPQFESVMTDSYKKMADAKTAAAGDKAKWKTSMTSIMKERDEALAKVLTPEQMKIYHEKASKMASHYKKQMSKSEGAAK